ncbi:MAG: dihydrofolate reductase family protein [Solirubrobacterales bacterium]
MRLYPVSETEQHTVDAGTAYADLDLASRAPTQRPYVIVNMVATADGQGRIGDNTAKLGNDTDMALFVQLREQVDCVMAGTSTIEAEQYKGPASKPETRERRVARGLRPRPLFATVTRSGSLPLDAPVFQDAAAEIAVFSDAEVALQGAAAKVTQVPTHDAAAILTRLHDDFGVRTLLLEGGPHLNAHFFAAELVDELFLTVAPVITGSGEPFPIIAGLLPAAQRLHLVTAMIDEDHLFLRYRVD